VHDRFWAAFGVLVVRRGEPAPVDEGAELYLLCEPGTMALFRLSQALDAFSWLDPKLLSLRLRDGRVRPYREVVATEDGTLVRFERVWRDARARSVRVGLTPDPALARRWQETSGAHAPWAALARDLPRGARAAGTASARVYDENDRAQLAECVADVLASWRRPDTTIPRARRVRPGVLADAAAEVADDAVFHGPVWIGAGQRVPPLAHVVGPAVLWDDPSVRTPPGDVRWREIEQASPGRAPSRAGGAPRAVARTIPLKRAFDVAFACGALALTLPLYPFVALAIAVEDGLPVFFAHRRESAGGREFPCLKFRTMRRDADTMKAALAAANQADGPQFFIDRDPRVTRVGRVLRKFHLDELPQFWNVLAGHMSVVGPRPSPYRENQFCPAWREARLSVRPGITGLWQVSRTRSAGLDFQEWIRFDLDYVGRAGWALDLEIIAMTLRLVVRGGG
jgi:lipopolysaccharide/colanic/teichoic acid biosynthesis glycosyltransferase